MKYGHRTIDESTFQQRGFASRLLDGLYSLLRFTDVYILEFISAITAIISWGVVLLMPGNTFATSRTYQAVAFAPEWFWAIVMMTFGGVQLLVLLLSLSAFLTIRIDLLRLRPIRRRISYIGVFLWGAIAAMLFISNPASTGWGTYFFAYTLGNAWVVWRLSLLSHR